LLQTANFSATATTINGTSQTVVGGGGNVTGGAGRTVIVTGSGSIANSGAGISSFTVNLLVGGTVVDSHTLTIPATPNASSFSLTAQVAIAAAGSHAVDLQIQGPGSSSGVANNCWLVAQVVNL
jgi:hypothetical protein